MKICYLILAHKSPKQLVRLVNRLNTSNSLFYIHVDAKADVEPFKNKLLSFDNVVFISKRASVTWGGFNMVRATLNGLQEIANKIDSDDYIVLLSGQDYPLKANDIIYNFLLENSGKIFLHWYKLPYKWLDGEGGLYRFQHYWVTDCKAKRLVNRIIKFLNSKFIPRKLPYGMKPYAGTQWWTISGACALYIIQFIKQHPFYIWFNMFTSIPDEMFFHNIIMNSKWSTSVINDDLHHIEFPGPKTFTIEDINKLCESEDLFARKFDIDVDSAVLDKIDSEFLHINISPFGESNNEKRYKC